MPITEAHGRIGVPWGCWYEDREEVLEFPPDWNVLVANPARELPPLTDDEIRQRLRQPIGTKPIRELARGKKHIAVAIDDLCRPTPSHQLLPLLIEELHEGGVQNEQIMIIVAIGSHRFLTRLDLLKKVGPSILRSVAIYNHHPYENLTFLGKTTLGTDVYVNRSFVEADLRISVGAIIPHAGAGMSAGPKTVGIGLAGIETILQNHDPDGPTSEQPEVAGMDSPIQRELLEMARLARLDCIFNVVLNRQRQTAAAFVGDVVKAHEVGARLAREAWMTEAPRLVDVGVFNAYPKDTEAIMALTALTPARVAGDPVVRKGGSIVITTASPEGAGIHSQEGYRMRGHRGYCRLPEEVGEFEDTQVIIYSPNLTWLDMQHILPPGYVVCNRWPEVIELLRARHARAPRVAVFPVAATQVSC